MLLGAFRLDFKFKVWDFFNVGWAGSVGGVGSPNFTTWISYSVLEERPLCGDVAIGKCLIIGWPVK